MQQRVNALMKHWVTHEVRTWSVFIVLCCITVYTLEASRSSSNCFFAVIELNLFHVLVPWPLKVFAVCDFWMDCHELWCRHSGFPEEESQQLNNFTLSNSVVYDQRNGCVKKVTPDSKKSKPQASARFVKPCFQRSFQIQTIILTKFFT